jgi:hypothetical protein
MYIASKDNDHNSDFGWVHIYDVSNPADPRLLKKFTNYIEGTVQKTMARAHTAFPSEDGKLLIVAEERPNGNVYIFDVTNIGQENDPDNPVWKYTFNRTNVGIDAHSPHHPHLHGKLLFLPWYEAGLQVFNLTNPAAPVHVGAFDTFSGTSASYNGNWGVDLSLGLSRVFLSDRSRGLIVVDASGVVIPGDYNQDMVVNENDYAVWRAAFGTDSSGLHVGALADGNFDGIVDGADYVVWRKNFGLVQSAGGSKFGSSSVPEPAMSLTFFLAISLLASRRRKRTARSNVLD